MTEATAEVQEAERPLERKVEEADVEANSSDRSYKSQAGEGRYTKKVESNSERTVADSKSIAEKFGMDTTKILSDGERRNEESAEEDSPHGAVTLISYTDPKTGEAEYLFEQKPLGYPKEKERGKFSLIGGARKIREPSRKAAEREILEEFVSSAASSILLKQGLEYYTTMSDVVDGQVVYTDIYRIDVPSKTDWEIVKASGLKEGTARAFKDKTAIRIDNQYYAFGYGEVVKGLIRENSTARPSWYYVKSNGSNLASIAFHNLN